MKKLYFLFLLTAIPGMTILAAAEADAPSTPQAPVMEMPPPPPPRVQGRMDRGMFWLAFNSMNEAERRELMKLQSSNPEEFKRKIKARAEEIKRKQTERFNHMKKLAEEYRSTSDNKRKTLCSQELETMLREDFLIHLQRGKHHVEEMKKKTARLESELVKREQNLNGAVQSLRDAILDGSVTPGEFPPPPRKQRQNRNLRP